ncbi:hypothetical protein RUM43_013367, partial [Polyplax serrata]
MEQYVISNPPSKILALGENKRGFSISRYPKTSMGAMGAMGASQLKETWFSEGVGEEFNHPSPI